MTTAKQPSVTWLYLIGFLTVAMGVVALASPLIAGAAVIFLVGAVMLVVGITQVIGGIHADDTMSHKLMALILGVVTTAGGLAALFHPLLGLEVLTLFLAAYFVAEGIWKVIASFNFRPAQGWMAMLFSGVVTWLLGALIWLQWPASGLWAVGILVGVDLLMTGMALLALAATVGKVSDQIDKQLHDGQAPA
ncbi:HdeD family acid-resistance protein [Bremerella cremea]|uniref:HdeD family acid-resistance protein n=1 Tax=Bremerella cremea TaxID=1031537 RepID=A0A368KMX5_9BACT|nr:HdeD family acid-resistance protein [Bremerella cremea]RCS41313.1 HdeD family acid-resistance protein [Bremerella cremea]